MKTLTEKFRGVLNESFSKKQFVRDARMEWPQLVNQFTGFNDDVAILKQKGMISEEDKMPEYAEYNNLSDEAIRRGVDAELEAMGLMSHDKVSEEDQAKAKEKALNEFKKLNFKFPVIISPKSYISKNSKILEGTIIHHNVIVNFGAFIGCNNIINTSSIIEHGVKIGDNCHIST